MVSKKRSGNENLEAVRGIGGVAKAMAKAREDTEAPGAHRGFSNAYQAGRRSLAYELAESGLLSSGRLGLEILFLLPDEFVTFYSELFHKALTVRDDSVMHGRSGGVEKAKGRQGMQLGDGSKKGEGRGPQASSTGKKWLNLPMSVGDMTALRAKDAMDRGLQDLTRDARRYLAEEQARKKEVDGVQGTAAQGTREEQKSGTRRDMESKAPSEQTSKNPTIPGRRTSSVRCSGSKCGRFMKVGWTFCPECGTRTE